MLLAYIKTFDYFLYKQCKLDLRSQKNFIQNRNIIFESDYAK